MADLEKWEIWDYVKDVVVIIMINELWNDIAEFEKNEIKNDSKNPLLSNARQGARMEAYVKLFENTITEVTKGNAQ